MYRGERLQRRARVAPSGLAFTVVCSAVSAWCAAVHGFSCWAVRVSCATVKCGSLRHVRRYELWICAGVHSRAVSAAEKTGIHLTEGSTDARVFHALTTGFPHSQNFGVLRSPRGAALGFSSGMALHGMVGMVWNGPVLHGRHSQLLLRLGVAVGAGWLLSLHSRCSCRCLAVIAP